MRANAWLDRKEYPFSSHYFSIGNAEMHYTDEGAGDVILFVHGIPSWSFEYRNIIKILSRTHRCIAPDLIGFGLSNKPEQYDYSLENQAINLEAFIRFLHLRNIILVVHDFSGPIGLRVATKYPQWIKQMVLLNTWAWNISNDVNQKLIRGPLLYFAYKWLNFSPRFLMPLSFGNKKIPKHILKHYRMPFGKPSERMAPIVFAQSFLTEEIWFDKLWSQLIVLYPVPVLIIWGVADPFVNPRYLNKFKKVFSTLSVKILTGTGHFPQEEEPNKVSRFILEFITENSFAYQNIYSKLK